METKEKILLSIGVILVFGMLWFTFSNYASDLEGLMDRQHKVDYYYNGTLVASEIVYVINNNLDVYCYKYIADKYEISKRTENTLDVDQWIFKKEVLC